MKSPLKRFGRVPTAVLSAVAIWSLGLLWTGTQQQAFAQAVGCAGAVTGAVPASGVVSDPACYDAYKLSYFDVATAFEPSTGTYGGPGNSGGAGDALLRIVDAGNFDTTNPGATAGDVCANIYVYNDVQEQMECCSCPLTANHLLNLSVINDLISNPFNPKESLSAGVIKIVGSSGACSNSATATTAAGPYTIAGGLHEWINHTELMFSTVGALTQSTSVDEFAHSELDAGELTSLNTECWNIWAHGSGWGRCKCGLGD